MDLGLADL
jgi:Ribulose bisphosphate carboxylase large chain, catalytic domain/Photosystem I psaA/psaB protein